MTRDYAAVKLLALGPLNFPDFWQITGWEWADCVDVLNDLIKSGKVVMKNRNFHHDPHYVLIDKT